MQINTPSNLKQSIILQNTVQGVMNLTLSVIEERMEPFTETVRILSWESKILEIQDWNKIIAKDNAIQK